MSVIEWFVVRTNPRCEERAASGIEKAGFHVHLPRGAKLIRRRHVRTKHRVEFPLLTGYLFVGLSRETPWFYELRQVDGVHSVLGRQLDNDPNRPQTRYIPISGAVVEEFIRLEALGQFEEKAKPFGRGDRVIVRSGPLAGLVVHFDDYRDGRKAARVLATLFGQMVAVEVPLVELEKAA